MSTRCAFFARTLAEMREWNTIDVPDAVMETVRQHAPGEEERMTPRQVAHVLRASRLEVPHLNHCHIIAARVNNKPFPIMPTSTEEELKARFLQLQEPYGRLFPQKSFLQTHYVIFKLLELMGQREYYDYKARSPPKMADMERMWMALCDELGWEFIPFQPADCVAT